MKTLYFSILSNSSWLNKGFAAIFISARTQVAAHTIRFSEGSRKRSQDITEPDKGKGASQARMEQRWSHSGFSST